MGLIKSIFGLIGGIFKAIAGLVGIGKKSEFYMELNDSDGSNSPAEAPVAKAVAPSAAAPTAASSTPEKVAPISAPSPTPAPVAAMAPAAAKPAQPAASVPSFAANYLTNAGAALPSRRRPGPSLSPFMDMAKQVRTQ